MHKKVWGRHNNGFTMKASIEGIKSGPYHSLSFPVANVYCIPCLLFSPGSPVSSANKTDRKAITEILLKVPLNTLTLPPCLLS